MPVPTSVASLQRFLGMINCLAKYIPNLSDIATPLRKLTHKETAWCWFPKHQEAFDRLKSCLSSTPVLAYYNVKEPVTLTCDVSCYGLGAACMQNSRPVAFVLHTLTDTETRYAQIERELLAVVFACTKFKDYIYGKPTIVETDHQPLVTIIKKSIHTAPAECYSSCSAMTSARCTKKASTCIWQTLSQELQAHAPPSAPLMKKLLKSWR